MTQNTNKTILTTSNNSGVWSSPISHSIVSTGTNFSTIGHTYPSNTSTISSPLQINGPIIYNNEETTYSQTYLHEVAVIAVTRSDGFIIKSKMVKTMWVETKNGGSIDFAAGKDPEVSKFESEDIIIKTLRTIKL